ncbi:C-terminal binding protein [Leucobacter sp. wl10]|uniref:C-terminal binding protein n=1 Tax=Leucobacter sp. wl10 TaxID=2304677 RepID=UPI000E5A43EA|nr:C-terminal binding protein [Leucobacter sp. wl10]RGE20499.1 C-terminal binding protein [Leucobacter sp. wl10]
MTVVVVTDHIFADLERERAFAARIGAEFRSAQCTSEHETIEAVGGANIVFVNFAPVTPAVLDALAPGAVVIRYGVGWDNVNVVAAAERGVSVCNVPDYGTTTVADHAVSLALTLLRRLHQFSAVISAGGWVKPASQAPIQEFSETTIGLFGTGKIGLTVAERLRPFGFTLLAHDPYANKDQLDALGIELVALDEFWSRSDLVTLHAPATPATVGAVNAESIAAMPRGSYVVNTARGALVDLDAVGDALESGQLAGVGLDVFEPEPLPEDHPIRSLENAILTPHAAFYSESSMQNLQRLAVEEAQRAALGEPLRCPVNRPVPHPAAVTE